MSELVLLRFQLGYLHSYRGLQSCPQIFSRRRHIAKSIIVSEIDVKLAKNLTNPDQSLINVAQVLIPLRPSHLNLHMVFAINCDEQCSLSVVENASIPRPIFTQLDLLFVPRYLKYVELRVILEPVQVKELTF